MSNLPDAPEFLSPLPPDQPQSILASGVIDHIVPEFGGRKGPEPTRYGDWEKDGKCTDF